MILRFLPTKDTTITNSFDSFFTERKEHANMGASDVLETFCLYDRDGDESSEISRILLKFDVDEIYSEISDFDIDNVKFILKLFNAPHAQTLPRDFTLFAYPVTHDWVEGEGLDMSNYLDEGGVSWKTFDTAPEIDDGSKDWTAPGGDYDHLEEKTFYFSDGTEDLEVDLTDWVKEWEAGTVENYGIIIKFSDEIEAGEENKYTKKFFSRTSQYFYKRPVIEVQYEDAINFCEDKDRQFFRKDSPLFAATDNYLYYYNMPRNVLEDIPDNGESDPITISVDIEDEDGTKIVEDLVPTWVRTGVYRVAVRLDANYEFDTAIDKWYIGSPEVNFYSGEIAINDSVYEKENSTKTLLSIKNHKSSYSYDEATTFNVDAAPFFWNPSIYVSYFEDGRSAKYLLPNTYYKVVRAVDDFDVFDFSYNDEQQEYTKLSYDKDKNYFKFDFSVLEPGYSYYFKFLTVLEDGVFEHPEVFKFRVYKNKTVHP